MTACGVTITAVSATETGDTVRVTISDTPSCDEPTPPLDLATACDPANIPTPQQEP
ncbi:MAG: hypothetical protein H6655_12790 [Ardenticatenaceae bacterium]|nr:hypothetical protein [Ardenticatenaceae bacterium]